ncbi:MAG TPA: carotenoid oxygenase family protein, partial [Acidimicrobiales bacterium]|nr:carotenoid oxygenase family protein [Acidimicrobiales bacterium]
MSKYLEGIYAPIPGDVTAVDLEVVGTLPPELEGRYLRNGPNPVTPVDPARYHWFTGDAMVHGVRLRDGRAAWYRARSVRSRAVSEALGEAPAPGERHGGMDTANTNVIGLAGRTYAIVEAGARPVELSYELDTVCHSDLGGTLPNGYTAHPKVDPATGDLHAIAYHWALPHLQYVVIGGDGLVRQVEPIEVPDGPMVHDCSITERWMVVYDLPVTFDVDLAVSGRRFPYTWNPSHPARVGLLPLGGRGDEVRWFEVAPCYVFHPVNAFDDGDRVVLDVVRYERIFDDQQHGP